MLAGLAAPRTARLIPGFAPGKWDVDDLICEAQMAGVLFSHQEPGSGSPLGICSPSARSATACHMESLRHAPTEDERQARGLHRLLARLGRHARFRHDSQVAAVVPGRK